MSTNELEIGKPNQMIHYLNFQRQGPDCIRNLLSQATFENCLTFLDLGGNKLGDVEACNLSKILRTNRTIKALNLSNNRIADIGVEALCEVCTMFTLADEEMAERRLLKMKIILDKKVLFDAVDARLKIDNCSSSLPQMEPCDNRKLHNSRKLALRNIKAKTKTRNPDMKKGPEACNPASLFTSDLPNPEEKGGLFDHPLLAEEKGESPYGLRIRGNYQLALLNLSRNLITDFGVNLLVKAISIQNASLNVDGFKDGNGLTDILLKGNAIEETGPLYKRLCDELQRKRELIDAHTGKPDNDVKLEAYDQ